MLDSLFRGLFDSDITVAIRVTDFLLCLGCSLLLGLARQGICFFPILPLMVRLWGVWGIASVQGAADMLVMLLAVPIAVRVSRDIRRREAGQGGEISPA